MTDTNILEESKQVRLAIELIELGARLQVLQAETEISRRRLINLYKEIHEASPPKGMLPFSTDWYVSWLPNIHASLFYNTYCQFANSAGHTRITSVAKAYRIYLEQTPLGPGFVRCRTTVRASGVMQSER